MPTLEYDGNKFFVDKMPTEDEFTAIAQHFNQIKAEKQQQTQQNARWDALNKRSSDAKAFGGEDPGVVTQLLGGAKHAWDSAALGMQNAAGALGLPTGESLSPLVQQGKAFVEETGPASSVGEFVAGAVPYIASGGFGAAAAKSVGGSGIKAATERLASHIIPNAATAALLAPEDKGTAAVIGGLAGALPSVLGASAAAIPAVTSGTPIRALYKAGQQGQSGYKDIMRGLSTADEAIEYGADVGMAKAAAKATDWLPDVKHGVFGGLFNYATGLGPVGTAIQMAATSPRIVGEAAYAAGRMSGMSNRLIMNTNILPAAATGIYPDATPQSDMATRVKNLDGTLPTSIVRRNTTSGLR